MQSAEKKKLVYGIAILFGGFLVYNFIAVPLYQGFKSRSDDIVKYEKQLKDGKNLITRERAIRDDWAAMKGAALPGPDVMAKDLVVESADRWAALTYTNGFGITITGVNPGSTRTETDHETVDFRIQAAGTISQIAKFIWVMENDPLALQIQEVELGTRDVTGQLLTMQVRFNGLLIKDVKEKADKGVK